MSLYNITIQKWYNYALNYRNLYLCHSRSNRESIKQTGLSLRAERSNLIKGLAKVVIMEKRRPLLHQEELLKAQEEAKKNKLGIWSQ